MYVGQLARAVCAPADIVASPTARLRKAVAFTLGWFTMILALGAIIILGLTAGSVEHTSEVTWLQAGLQLGFGLALLLFAGDWRRSRMASPGVASALD